MSEELLTVEAVPVEDRSGPFWQEPLACHLLATCHLPLATCHLLATCLPLACIFSCRGPRGSKLCSQNAGRGGGGAAAAAAGAASGGAAGGAAGRWPAGRPAATAAAGPRAGAARGWRPAAAGRRRGEQRRLRAAGPPACAHRPAAGKGQVQHNVASSSRVSSRLGLSLRAAAHRGAPVYRTFACVSADQLPRAVACWFLEAGHAQVRV